MAGTTVAPLFFGTGEGREVGKEGGKEEEGREELHFAVQNHLSVTLNCNRMALEEISKGSPDLLLYNERERHLGNAQSLISKACHPIILYTDF